MATAIPEIRKQRISKIKSQITESREGVPHLRNLFGFLTLACGRNSSPAVTVPEKTRRRKKKKKKQRRNTGSCPENVCCTPPVIGFTYDVAQSTTADAHRRNHRQRSRSARQAMDVQQPCSTPQIEDANETFIRSNVSDSTRYNQFQRRSPGGISEIVMFEHNSLLDRRIEGSDRFGAWRINADLMSYEELVELSDRIGYVDGGLQEDEILECLKEPKKSFLKSFDFNSKVKDSKCSICQEECKGDEDLGKLKCGHYHHLDCIKQWLLRKNECPICKTVAKANKWTTT